MTSWVQGWRWGVFSFIFGCCFMLVLYMYGRLKAQAHSLTQVHMLTHTNTYIGTYTYTGTHTHTQVHTHAQTNIHGLLLGEYFLVFFTVRAMHLLRIILFPLRNDSHSSHHKVSDLVPKQISALITLEFVCNGRSPFGKFALSLNPFSRFYNL